MRKTAKTNPEFDNFTVFMDKLAKVTNTEVKAALEKEGREKAAKKQARPTPNGGK